MLPDVWGAAGLVISVGAAVWALIEAPERTWTRPPVLVAFAVAALTGAAVVRRSMRHP
ncbi:hypothetical protein [Mycolicibacterium sp.]|uniref:hypothetical protein n=1 Tax=Mycolicibacterium sp. TaxID=2320850 RepID=UPI003D14F240